jgi:ubiquilin
MIDANPLMRSMLSNPQFLQTMMNPTFLQNMSSMMNTMNSGGSTAGLGFQDFPSTNFGQTNSNSNTSTTTNTNQNNQQSSTSTSTNPTTSTTTNPFMNNPFSNPFMFYNPFMPMNNMSSMNNTPLNNQNVDPKEKYKEQNLKLKDMGFINDDVNFEVLAKTGGNIDAAVERLLNMLK